METRVRVVIVFLIFILIIGILGTLYYFYKDSSSTENNGSLNKTGIFLRTYNNVTGKQIQTNYAVYYPESDTIEKGKTLSEGILKIYVETNKSFYLMTFNEGNESYYSTLWDKDPKRILSDQQVDLSLYPYGNLNITQFGSITQGKQINLSIAPIGYLTDLIPCVRWSANFITVKIKDLENRVVPGHLENKVDKCYNEISPNSNLTIDFDYFGGVGGQEFIKVYFVDLDIIKESVPARIPDFKEKDLAREDIIYILN